MTEWDAEQQAQGNDCPTGVGELGEGSEVTMKSSGGQAGSMGSRSLVSPHIPLLLPTMAKKSTATTTASHPAPSPPLAWPPIAHEPDLELTALSEDLHLIDGFFSRQSLKQWRSFLPSIPMQPPAPPQKGYADRTNHRFSVQDPAFATQLWEHSGLKELCESGIASGVQGKRAVGLNPNIRLYSYSAGAYFGRELGAASSETFYCVC